MIHHSLGVVVGRFQVSELRAEHLYLIDTAAKANGTLLIILTTSGGQATDQNPLDLKTRTIMILSKYPNAIIRAIHDMSSNQAWSDELDAIILEVATDAPVKIYESPDSTTNRYIGKFKTEFAQLIPSINETNSNTKELQTDDAKYRQGMIYAVLNRFPTAYQTVDVVIHRRETREILLGRKTHDDDWRFVGGFVDPTDESLELAVKRECHEETDGIEIGEPRYIGSMKIDDVRYRGTTDGIMTAIFVVQYIFGAPKGTDDLAEVRWVRIEDVEGCLVTMHRKIWEKTRKAISD
jgi:bifunctional NMN adenylyltransferase/nudix hydrolase